MTHAQTTISEGVKSFREKFPDLNRWNESHGKWENCEDEAETFLTQFAKDVERATLEDISAYTTHDPRCIRSQFEAGRPREDGGYEQKFDGHWYRSNPVDETPKCDCGLDDLLTQKEIKKL